VSNGLEGLLEILNLDVKMEGIRTGTHADSWRESISDFRGYIAETGCSEVWTD